MEFSLDETQAGLVRAVGAIVDRHEPMVATDAEPSHDRELEAALADAGYLDVATTGGTLLDAALVSERVARSSAVLPVGYRAFVAPLLGDAVSWPFTLIHHAGGGIARFATTAADVVAVDGGGVTAFAADECDVEPKGAAWG